MKPQEPTARGRLVATAERSCPKCGATNRAEIREAEPPPQWQPIETAPKDGTEILVCGRLPGESRHQTIIASMAVNEWWTRDAGDVPCKITHWMPLPEGPAQESKS